MLEAGTQWRGLRYPLRQRLGPEEVENLPAARCGVEAVGEVGHRAVGLEQEGQRARVRRQLVGQPGGVFRGLLLDAGEGALGLRLHRAQGLAVEVEQIIGETEAGLHRELAHGDTAASGKVKIAAILNEPARSRQVGVDFAAGFLFWGLRHNLTS